MENDVAYSWYVLQVQAGCEDKISSMLRANKFVENVLVPVKDVQKIHRNKRVNIKRKMLAGYMFLKMSYSVEMFENIIAIPKVYKFLKQGDELKVVTQQEIDNICASIKEKEVDLPFFVVGEEVRIIEGPFESFSGTIEVINDSSNTIQVNIVVFGRPTSVKLSSAQVEKIDDEM